MKLDKTAQRRQTPQEAGLTRLLPLTKADIDGRTEEMLQTVIETCTTEEEVRLSYLGCDLVLRPLDTRRFVRVMSQYISFN